MVTPNEDSAPWVIADHTVLRRIGVGAYGEVWLARNVMGVARAVKIVRRERFEGARSYEREFIGLTKFEPISRTHDGLVDILQVGRDDVAGFFYYIMELADSAQPGGEPFDAETYQPLTLQERIKQAGRMTVADSARIGASVADALGFLHGQGLIHRDVKPSNIIYIGGRPKLADVGLVASVGDAKSFVGTEGFIAPEGPGSARSDLYSFGKVLYEMATGKSRLDFPDIPQDLQVGDDGGEFAELNEVLLRACAPEARDRHASAAELRGELLLLDAGRSVRQLRRNERLMASWRRVGVAALIAAGLVAAAFYLERQRSQAARLAVEAEAAVRRAIEEREMAARRNLYAADMNLAQQALDAGNYGRAEALLGHYNGLPAAADVRGVEWFYFWQRLRGDSVAVLAGHQQVVSSLVLNRAGDGFYSASFDSTVREWSLSGPRLLRQWERPGCLFMNIALDPSGTRIAGEGGNRGYSAWLNLETGNWVTSVSSASPSITFSPDGNRLLRGARTMLFETNGVIEVTDLDFNVERVLPASGGRIAFAPGGMLFATGAWAGSIRLWSWPELESLGELREAGTVIAMSFSPEANRLASVSREGRLCLWDLSTRRLKSETSAHGGSIIWSVAFSPDGKRLATGGNDQAVRVWNAESLVEEHVLRGHGGEVWSVIWTPDGRQLVSAGKDKTIRLWSAVRAAEFPKLSGVAQSPVFSADERWMAVRKDDGTASVWEVESGREVMRMESILEVGGVAESGDSVVVLTMDGAVERRSVAQGGTVVSRRNVKHPSGPFNRRLLSRDGRWLATGMRDGGVYVCNVEHGGQPHLLSGHSEMVVSLAFSPDSRTLLSGAIDRTARLWNLERREQLATISGHTMGVGSVAFSKSGARFATGSWDDSVQVWDTLSRRQIALLGGHQGGVQAVGFSPDDRSLVALTGTSVLTFWNLGAQREAGAVPLPGGTGQGWVTVSQAGRWVAAVSQAGVLRLLPAPRGGNETQRNSSIVR